MGKTWKKLHRYIYVAAIAGILHYYWQLKGNLAEPLFYLILIVLLLGFRVAVWFKNRKFNKMMIPTSKRLVVVPINPVVIPETIPEPQEAILKSLRKRAP